MELTNSIIIPAHNEEKRIAKTLDDYCSFFPDAEIIVVLNACSDNTLDIILDYKKKYKNLSYVNLIHGGKGYALTNGFKIAQGDIVGFTDADGSTSAKEYNKLIDSLLLLGVDGVIASRKMKNSIVNPKQPPIRQLAGYTFNWIVRLMFGFKYKDTQTGAKVFTAEAVKDISRIDYCTQWAFDVSLLYELKRQGYEVEEIGIEWNDCDGSKVKIFRSSIRMFLSIVRLRILYSPFNPFLMLYNKLPDWMKVHHLI